MRIKRYEFLGSVGRCNGDSKRAVSGSTCKSFPVRVLFVKSSVKAALPADVQEPSEAASGVSSYCIFFTPVSRMVIYGEIRP